MTFGRLVAFLIELGRGKFYGEVMIRFREGRIVVVERRETFTADLPVNDPVAAAMVAEIEV